MKLTRIYFSWSILENDYSTSIYFTDHVNIISGYSLHVRFSFQLLLHHMKWPGNLFWHVLAPSWNCLTSPFNASGNSVKIWSVSLLYACANSCGRKEFQTASLHVPLESIKGRRDKSRESRHRSNWMICVIETGLDTPSFCVQSENSWSIYKTIE